MDAADLSLDSIDEHMIRALYLADKFADCTRRQVGAVLVSPSGEVIARGWNGAPVGQVGCVQGGCPRSSSGVEPGSSYDTGAGSCIAVHAEQRVLLRASWEDMDDAILYITHEPCDGCRRTLWATPIKAWVTPAGTTLNSQPKEPR